MKKTRSKKSRDTVPLKTRLLYYFFCAVAARCRYSTGVSGAGHSVTQSQSNDLY
jgi:hypothetical protein